MLYFKWTYFVVVNSERNISKNTGTIINKPSRCVFNIMKFLQFSSKAILRINLACDRKMSRSLVLILYLSFNTLRINLDISFNSKSVRLFIKITLVCLSPDENVAKILIVCCFYILVIIIGISWGVRVCVKGLYWYVYSA